MDFKEFVAIMQEKMSKKTGKEVIVTKVTKNNNIKLTSLVIKENAHNVSPNIYVEQYWELYQRTDDLEEAVEAMYKMYNQSNIAQSINMEWFRGFEEVKGKVAYKLVNYEYNKELLEQIPHTKYLDLAKVYYVSVEDEAFGKGTILIHNNHLEMWSVSAEQLEELAAVNTPKQFPMIVRALEDILCPEITDNSGWDLKNGIFVMTNEGKNLGAATMLYPNNLKAFAGLLQSDLIIIPCSLHEVLILSANTDFEIEGLKKIVKVANRESVLPEDFLSNSLYYYDRETDSIKVL